jgi:drug/metabolite transporter (DMT)-like permease
MADPAAATSRERILANAGVWITILAWSSLFPGLQIALRGWHPLALAPARLALAALVMLVYLACAEGVRGFTGGLPWKRLFVLGTVGICGYMTLMSFGLVYAGAVSAAIISTLTPAVAALMARFVYGERLTRTTRWAAAAAVLGGVIVALGGPRQDVHFLGGELLLFAALVAWVWYQFGCQKHLLHLSQAQVTTFTSLTATIASVTVALIVQFGFGQRLAMDLSADSLLLVAYLSMAAGGFILLLWHYAIRRLGVTVTAICYNTTPVLSLCLTALLIGDRPTPLQAVGGAVIVGSALFAQVRAERDRRRAALSGTSA